MKIQSLASGSKGNLTLVCSEKTKILIDQGLSTKQAVIRLEEAGHSPESIDAIIITHEHSDHIKGVRVFSKKYGTPVFLNQETCDIATAKLHLRDVKDIRIFRNGEDFHISDLTIHPFGISHDAADPVNFIIKNGGSSFAHITDLGFASTLVTQKIKTVDYLFLEANHDLDMLKNGPYPLELQRRVKSKFGHLSNEQSLELLLKILEEKELKGVTLLHLSENNNDPQLVKDYFTRALQKLNKHVKLEISSQYRIGKSQIID